MTDYHFYKDYIDICLRCAAICNHCASSCTEEKDVTMMARCIRLGMECAAVCYATAQLMSLGSEYSLQQCSICVDICESCAAECSKHSNKHCQECAKICKQCAEACRKLLVS